jgi:hypothetical protein
MSVDEHARTVLLGLLADGGKPRADCLDALHEAGVSNGAIERVRVQLGLIPYREKGDKRWRWALPAHAPAAYVRAHESRKAHGAAQAEELRTAPTFRDEPNGTLTEVWGRGDDALLAAYVAEREARA